MKNIALRIDTGFLKIIFIFFAGFFLPWGNSLKTFSVFFPYLLLIPTAFLTFFLFRPLRRISMPMCVFISFLILHTMVTAIVIGPDYFTHVAVKFDYFEPDLTNAMQVYKLASFILYFVILSLVIVYKKEYMALCLGFVSGLAVGSILKFPEYLNYFQINRFTGTYNDPNVFAISAGVAFFLCLFLSQQIHRKIFSNMLVLSAWIFFILVLLSQSRGGILALVLAGCYFFRGHRHFFKGLFLAGIVCMLSLPLFSSRILDVNQWVESGGTGRIDIWAVYLSHMREYFLTGVGFGFSNNTISTRAVAGVNLIPHNFFLEIFVEFGIIGLLLLLAVLWYFWRLLTRNQQYRTIAPIVIVWMVGVSFISGLLDRETWFVLVLLERVLVLSEDA